MKKIRFTEHILPHVIAISVFLIVTIFFFKPLFFDGKTLEQHDILQFQGSAKAIIDYREKTGEEALWAPAIFSGMPAFLISVQWGNKVIAYVKTFVTLSMSTAPANIYLAFLCYYIMLVIFGVRPYLAIAGAIAFGLSSYMIIGIGAGHNARVGAIAFMPLVMGGIHLMFTNRKLIGFGLTSLALSLHLRENHLQITYYFLIILGIYLIIRLLEKIQEKDTADYFKSIGLLAASGIIAGCTFFGPMWAIMEYQSYSIRGKSDLPTQQTYSKSNSGISKEYAFAYSDGILEPFTLLIPNFYGGSSMRSLAEDQSSETSSVIRQLASSGNEQLVNQLYPYTVGYWGPQFNTSPYYAGAIIVFLFAVGVAFANKRLVWWLGSITVIGIVLSWGSNFAAFNYFLFDYLPGYNKFRSVTFALLLPLFAMPLLGLMGIEKLWQLGITKETKKKLIIAFASTGGVCLALILFAGVFDFTKDTESTLPGDLLNALITDRKSLFRADAIRSLAFITAAFILLYFDVHKRISPIGFYAFLILMTTIDLAVVDKRYFSDSQFKRKRESNFFAMNEADHELLKDQSYHRVYNLQWEEARTSYYHNSIGGYHGAKLRRYQDFYDSCISLQTRQLYGDAQQRQMDMNKYTALNMLNVKYIVFGPERSNIIYNNAANGNAWFVREIVKVKTPAEELAKTCGTNTRQIAIIDESKFQPTATGADSTSTITITETKPNKLVYKSASSTGGLAVFSEIYYPGWVATIDGKETAVMRADYLLRAIEVPSGDHTIEFTFRPKAYTVGNKITTASSWLVLMVFLGSVVMAVRKSE